MVTRIVGTIFYSMDCKKEIIKHALIHTCKLYENGVLLSVGRYNATNKGTKDFNSSIKIAIDNALKVCYNKERKSNLKRLRNSF